MLNKIFTEFGRRKADSTGLHQVFFCISFLITCLFALLKSSINVKAKRSIQELYVGGPISHNACTSRSGPKDQKFEAVLI
jgi:hypothetical protein